MIFSFDRRTCTMLLGDTDQYPQMIATNERAVDMLKSHPGNTDNASKVLFSIGSNYVTMCHDLAKVGVINNPDFDSLKAQAITPYHSKWASKEFLVISTRSIDPRLQETAYVDKCTQNFGPPVDKARETFRINSSNFPKLPAMVKDVSSFATSNSVDTNLWGKMPGRDAQKKASKGDYKGIAFAKNEKTFMQCCYQLRHLKGIDDKNVFFGLYVGAAKYEITIDIDGVYDLLKVLEDCISQEGGMDAGFKQFTKYFEGVWFNHRPAGIFQSMPSSDQFLRDPSADPGDMPKSVPELYGDNADSDLLPSRPEPNNVRKEKSSTSIAAKRSSNSSTAVTPHSKKAKRVDGDDDDAVIIVDTPSPATIRQRQLDKQIRDLQRQKDDLLSMKAKKKSTCHFDSSAARRLQMKKPVQRPVDSGPPAVGLPQCESAGTGGNVAGTPHNKQSPVDMNGVVAAVNAVREMDVWAIPEAASAAEKIPSPREDERKQDDSTKIWPRGIETLLNDLQEGGLRIATLEAELEHARRSQASAAPPQNINNQQAIWNRRVRDNEGMIMMLQQQQTKMLQQQQMIQNQSQSNGSNDIMMMMMQQQQMNQQNQQNKREDMLKMLLFQQQMNQQNQKISGTDDLMMIMMMQQMNQPQQNQNNGSDMAKMMLLQQQINQPQQNQNNGSDMAKMMFLQQQINQPQQNQNNGSDMAAMRLFQQKNNHSSNQSSSGDNPRIHSSSISASLHQNTQESSGDNPRIHSSSGSFKEEDGGGTLRRAMLSNPTKPYTMIPKKLMILSIATNLLFIISAQCSDAYTTSSTSSSSSSKHNRHHPNY